MDIRKLLVSRRTQSPTSIRRGMCRFVCLMSAAILASGIAGPTLFVTAAPGPRTIDFTAHKKSSVVSILGEVERCGAYRFPPGNVELLAVIRAAGGFKDTSAGTVRVLRNNRISEVLFGVNQSTSYQLQAGDLLIADQLHEHRPGLVEFPKPGETMNGSKEFAAQRTPDIAIINLADYPILFSPTRPGHTIWELLRGLQQRPEELREVTILRHKTAALTLDLTKPLPKTVSPDQLKLTHNMVVVLPTETVNRSVINQLPAEMFKVTDVTLTGELASSGAGTNNAAPNGEAGNESASAPNDTFDQGAVANDRANDRLNNPSNPANSRRPGSLKYGKPRLNTDSGRSSGPEQNAAPDQYNGAGQYNGLGQYNGSRLPTDATAMLDDRETRGVASPGVPALNSPGLNSPGLNSRGDSSGNRVADTPHDHADDAAAGPRIRPQRPAAGPGSKRLTAAVPSPGSAAYPVTEGLEPEQPDTPDAPAISHRPRDMHEQQYVATDRERLPPVPSDVVTLPAPGVSPSESQRGREWGPVAMESRPQAGPVPFPGRDPGLAADQLPSQSGSALNTAQVDGSDNGDASQYAQSDSENRDAATSHDAGLAHSEHDNTPGPKTAMLARNSHPPIGSLPKTPASSDVELSAEAAGSATGATGIRSNTLASILAPMGLVVIGSVLLFLHRRANRIGAETSTGSAVESRIIPLPKPVAKSAATSPASAKLPAQFAAAANAAVGRSAIANRTTAAAVAAAMSRPEVLQTSGTHWLTEQVALPLEMTFYGRAHQGEALRVDADHETPQPPQMNVLAGSLEPKAAAATRSTPRPASPMATGTPTGTAATGQGSRTTSSAQTAATSKTDRPIAAAAGSNSAATTPRSRSAGSSPLDRALLSVRGARS